MPIAQLNLARSKYPLDDPRMAGFMDNIARVNGLAMKMPGFVWRFPEEPEGHPDHEPLPWPDMTLTMSVWESAEDLHHFVWNTLHKRFYEQRQDWFAPMDTHWLVMWRVPDGHRPTLVEAKERLDHLDAHGDSDFAFGWSHLAESLAIPAQ